MDTVPFLRVFGRVFDEARRWDLTVYDAAYLELALRRGLPLVTLDTPIKKAAKAVGIPVVSHRTAWMLLDSVNVAGAALELIQGDITQQDVDAIVNAANSGLMGGGGVDGAIHRAGGPAILAECKEIRKKLPKGLPTGQAVMTTGGKLKAKYVIHAVGPRWRGGNKNEPQLLASCYLESLKLAAEKSLKSVAFPSISTGIYGYPVEKAAPIAISAVKTFLGQKTQLTLVRFVLFDERTFSAYASALKPLNHL